MPRLFMILLDQEPLRRSVAAECTEAMERLEEARLGWHRFEREDKPAFARWRAREFGALLSKAREVELQIRDCQALVHEVEMEMRRGFQDAHSAYQRVMFRRENSSAGEAAAPEPNESSAGRAVSDFEKEALFQDWVKRSLGTNPDKMDDEAYTTSFEAFKTHMFRNPQDEPARSNTQRGGGVKIRIEPDDGEEESDAAEVDLRLKELYRRLVRRLHPDLRTDGNAAVSSLWHEVQEAYLAGDVARMEILLALSDIATDHLSDETSVGQMQYVLAELARATRALEKNMSEAEREDAWNFARSGPNPELRLRTERQIKSEFAARSMRLDLLKRTIADWARGPVRNRKAVIR